MIALVDYDNLDALTRRRGVRYAIAGEGKTSLIDHLAVKQAQAYMAKTTDWLLVPIPLGGRTFLRFDWSRRA